MGIQNNNNFCTLIVNDMCTENGTINEKCKIDNFQKCVNWKNETNFPEFNTILRDTLKQLVVESIEQHSVVDNTIPEHKSADLVSETPRETTDTPTIIIVRSENMHTNPSQPTHVNPNEIHHSTRHAVDVADVHSDSSQISVPNLKERTLPVVIQRPEQPFPNTKVQGVPAYDGPLNMPDLEIEKLCMDYLNTK